MLTIGNLAMRQARAQFSCNFLATAGYEVVDNLGFTTVDEGVKAALDAKADIVVLCSSDDEYAEYAIPAYRAIGDKAIFIVAGAPACTEELQAAGISTDSELAYGDPAKEIVKWVEQKGCDLVAMSTHGHRFLADIFLGTTASRVQHNISVPVLLLRAK
jgi:nucleotide-binding universal stress UspA family protein